MCAVDERGESSSTLANERCKQSACLPEKERDNKHALRANDGDDGLLSVAGRCHRGVEFA